MKTNVEINKNNLNKQNAVFISRDFKCIDPYDRVPL